VKLFGVVFAATAALLVWSFYHHLRILLALISHLTEILREEV